MKKITALLLALVMVLALAACGNGNDAKTNGENNNPPQQTDVDVKQDEAADPEGGFEEVPIWEDEEIGFMNVNGVYFQPVPMSGGFENYEDYNLHFEADVSALPNNLGYGVGDWIPYMKVEYKLEGQNTGTVIEGTFMPMNADDGNHYGNNLKMDVADSYKVTLTFHSPAESGFLIHLDSETGPGGRLEDYEWPLVLEVSDLWDYAPTEW